MLDGLDDVDWGSLHCAYGPATRVPDFLRRFASGADEWLDRNAGLYDFHGGWVYPAAAAAVPFLVEIAESLPGKRAEIFSILALLGDPEQMRGDNRGAVRAAMVGCRDRFAGYLGDADASVRKAAAEAFGVAEGDPGPLWARWSVERETDVRVAVLLGLGRCDPHGCAAAARHAVLHEQPRVRLAAAIVLVRNGFGLPDGGVEAVVAVMELRTEDLHEPYVRGDHEIVTLADDQTAIALVDRMCASSQELIRSEGVLAAIGRMREVRPAAEQLLPLVTTRLADADEDVRRRAVQALRMAGPDAAAHADALAQVASVFPATIGHSPYAPETDATRTLMFIGDSRWVDLVAATAPTNDDRIQPGRLVRWTDAVGEAIRPHLAGPALRFFAQQISSWGSSAAALRPELEALLPDPVAALALWRVVRGGAIQPQGDATALVEGLRAVPGELDAAIGVWRLAGDPEPVIAALGRMLATGVSGSVPGLDGPGEDLRALLEDALEPLSGTAAKTYEQRGTQLLAAQIVWRVTGSASSAAATLAAILRCGGVAAYWAAELVADLADTFDPVAPGLRLVLRQRLRDPVARVAAARALWGIGEPLHELIPPVLAAISAGPDLWRGVPLLVKMRATVSIPALRELAERPDRLPVTTIPDNIAWEDETARAELRAAIEALGAPSGVDPRPRDDQQVAVDGEPRETRLGSA